MIINADFVNQHCHKKLGYYDIDKMKIEDAEEIFINFEINILNNLSVYTDIIKNCLPNNLRKLVLSTGVFLNEETTKNFSLTLEELDLKNSSGEIKFSLPNLKKINASGLKLLGFYEKLEEAHLKEIKEIPDTLRKLEVDVYNNNCKNLEELKFNEFKGGTFGEKLKILDAGTLEITPNIFEKCYHLNDFNIFCLKNTHENSYNIFQNCQNLKKIFISKGDYQILDYLPKNLEKLNFDTGIGLYYNKSFPKIELSNLPSSLKTLKLGSLKSNLDFLPPIKKLNLNYVMGKFTNLPSSIEKFNYFGFETEINLPDNINKRIHFTRFKWSDDVW